MGARCAPGPCFADVEIQQFVFSVNITNDSAGTAEVLAPIFHLAPDAVLRTPVALVGPIDQIVDELIARRERWQMSYIVVADIVADVFCSTWYLG